MHSPKACGIVLRSEKNNERPVEEQQTRDQNLGREEVWSACVHGASGLFQDSGQD